MTIPLVMTTRGPERVEGNSPSGRPEYMASVCSSVNSTTKKYHQPELKNHIKDIHAGEKREKWSRNPFQQKLIIIIFAFNFDAISFILEPNWKKLDHCLRT
jgi:hypothetical protein